MTTEPSDRWGKCWNCGGNGLGKREIVRIEGKPVMTSKCRYCGAVHFYKAADQTMTVLDIMVDDDG